MAARFEFFTITCLKFGEVCHRLLVLVDLWGLQNDVLITIHALEHFNFFFDLLKELFFFDNVVFVVISHFILLIQICYKL